MVAGWQAVRSATFCGIQQSVEATSFGVVRSSLGLSLSVPLSIPPSHPPLPFLPTPLFLFSFFQMYSEMAGRHRARPRSIQIIRTATIGDDEVKRPNMLQYTGGNVKFPLPHRIVRAPSKKLRTTFKASRPDTHFN